MENNPIVSALAEFKAIFPLIKKPDLFLSLGTGSASIKGGYPTTVGQLKIWRNRTLLRLYRLFMEKTRDRLLTYAFKADPGVHRLDIDLEGEEPRLDDADSISVLKAQVQSEHSLSPMIDLVSRRLTASLFYFELNAAPERINGDYCIRGNVLCHLRCVEPAYKALLEQLVRDSAELFVNNIALPGSFEDDLRFHASRQFRRSVSFNLADGFSISIKRHAMSPCHISGSPFSVDALLTSQGFNSFFGRSDHRKRKFIGEDSPRKRRRL